ncbi:MAG TPA: RDD family protein, partial [Actinomycetes bacterium]|nr:RDD family protein [Actinomycetes bacterium]
LLLTLVAMIGYETLMLANGGQTLGKMLLGLRVVRADLAPPTIQDGLVRALVIDLLWIVPFGWLLLAVMIERQPRRQGWHDRAAGTLVVRSRA